MLDCFRTGGANSPETFVTAVAATLARYPDHVIFEVTNPMSGLPVQLTWMPSVKDVHDACEKEMEPVRRRERQAKIAAETVAARSEPPREDRPTITELKAKYGENWGLSSLDEPKRRPTPAPTKEELAAHYREYGLAFKPKNQNELEDHIDRGFSPASI